jgi:hypothetical protein
LIGNIKGCEFEFNLAGLLKQGENTVTFHNVASTQLQGDYGVVLEDIELRLKAKGATAVELKPAPTVLCRSTSRARTSPRPGAGWSSATARSA